MEVTLELFREKGAYLEGHFLLSSGLHSPNYMQCAKILQFPSIASHLGEALGAHFSNVDIVLSPAIGGIIIGHEVARSLDRPFIFCEREDKEFKLRRGFRIEPGQRVVVIEDVLTTGRSTRETVAVAEWAGGQVTGVGAIVDRSAEPLKLPGEFHALMKIPLAQYPADACPLCLANIPLIKPGSRPV